MKPSEHLERLRVEHADWSQQQFGDVSAVGPAKHLAKEALEVAANPSDVVEHADCWMLLWDMQRRAGISDAELALAISQKLTVNKLRKWPPPQEGEAREHLKPKIESLEELAAQLSVERLCSGLVVFIASELKRRGSFVLTADEDNIGAQFIELMELFVQEQGE